MISCFKKGQTQGVLPGPVGDLEVLLVRGDRVDGVAIICHPHPLHQGTMQNKVVTALARACAEQHMATVRFNYRGVGQSGGTYGHFDGEVEDLLSIYRWVQVVMPDQPLYLAGFSFGAYIAASVASRIPSVHKLVCVAPAVNHVDYSALVGVTCPWLVVQGMQDEVVPADAVCRWAKASPAIELVCLPEAGHFFHGQLLPLQAAVREFLAK